MNKTKGEKNMIAYKVVEKRSRRGSNYMIAFGDTHYNPKKRKYLNELIIKNDLQVFFPQYFKNKIIKAKKGSIGILCFENVRSCKFFIKDYRLKNYKIIKIETYGDITRNPMIISSCADFLRLKKYRQKSSYINAHIDLDIIACPAVKVLE